MSEGYVRVAPDSSGKKVETVEVIRQSSDSGATTAYETVERQRVEVEGPVEIDSGTLTLILAELRVITKLLIEGFNIRVEEEHIRQDATLLF